MADTDKIDQQDGKGGATSSAEHDATQTASPSQQQQQRSLAADGLVATFAMSPGTTATALVVLVAALALRAGLTAILLVPLCSTLLLLNPWVRTFLELPSIHAGEDSDAEHGSGTKQARKRRLMPFDPAHFLGFATSSSSDNNADDDDDGGGDDKGKAHRQGVSKAPLDRSGAYAALRRMPAHLRTPLSDLEELIIRDCITNWYNYHSFGDESLPNEARYSIDHAIGSVYTAAEHTKSADVTAELLLAAASVLLVTLRYRRLYPNRAPIFSTDRERIQALRDALDRVFRKHGRSEDGQCDLLRVLLREIISKQVWNAICGVGQPDFINQKIVEWDEKKRAKEGKEAAGTYDAYEARYPAPVPGMSGYRRPGSAPGADAPLSPTLAKQHLPQQLATPSAAERGASPSAFQPARRRKVSTETSASPVSAASSQEPLTKQPTARMMPMAVGRSPTPAKSMDSDFTRQHLSPTVDQGNGSPSIAMPSPRLRQGSFSEGSQSGRGAARRTPSENDDNRNLWDSMVMPMNVPPSANEGMALPESLRKSLRSGESDESGRRSLDVARSSSEGYQLSNNGERLSLSSTSSPRRPMLPLDSFPEDAAVDSDRRSVRPSTSPRAAFASPTTIPSSATSEGFPGVPFRSRPPSRTASAASGGIPPAPDLAEVLSSNSPSSGTAGLRDAFEAFLERGGVASRSLFFSPPSAATVASGEGEALLKLHVGLTAIARLVPSDADRDGEAYREDAATIVKRALLSLTSADDSVAGRPLRESLAFASSRLRVSAKEQGSLKMRDALQPVETALWARLYGLYEHFWKETCTRPGTSAAASAGGAAVSSNAANRGHTASNTPVRGSFTEDAAERKRISRDVHENGHQQQQQQQQQQQAPRGGSGLAYEPRKKGAPTAPQQQNRVHTEPEQTEHPNEQQTETQSSGMVGTARDSEQQSKPIAIEANTAQDGSSVMRPVARHAEKVPPTPEAPTGPEITVTDVSPNAERPDAAVDLRQYEVMIAVEGLVTGSGGFVLLRHWKDFVQLQEELSRTEGLPATPAPLPNVKGKTSAVFSAEIERYLRQLLASPHHITSEALQHFVDKARGGERSEENRFGALLDSMQLSKGLGLGRTLASGVGTVGRTAFNTLQMVPSGVAGVPRRAGQLASDALAGGPVTGNESIGDDTVEGDTILANDSELAHLPLGVRRTRGDSRSSKTRQAYERTATDDSRAASASGGREAGNGPQPRRIRSQESLPSSPQARASSAGRRNANNMPSSATAAAPEAPAHAPPTDFSQTDLDNLLSCIFAIADEAFNLSGGWTFRRGMLRVFEQIVRTQYWSSLLGVFNNLAHTLNEEQIGQWCADIKTKFWPDEKSGGGGSGVPTRGESKQPPPAPTSASSPPEALGPKLVEAVVESDAMPQVQAAPAAGPDERQRTAADKAVTHAKAQAVLLRHVPASSAYFLGPGGRQSGERAVLCVHEAVCDPATSLDLVLTVVLKLCDIVAS